MAGRRGEEALLNDAGVGARVRARVVEEAVESLHVEELHLRPRRAAVPAPPKTMKRSKSHGVRDVAWTRTPLTPRPPALPRCEAPSGAPTPTPTAVLPTTAVAPPARAAGLTRSKSHCVREWNRAQAAQDGNRGGSAGRCENRHAGELQTLAGITCKKFYM